MTSDKQKILLIGGAAIAAYLLFFNKQTGADGSAAVPDYEGGGGVAPSPYIEVGGYATPLQSALAVQNRNYLYQWAGTNDALKSAFSKMNDQEINASYDYMWGYVLKGKTLYQYPGTTGIYIDGGWNTVLYNQIAAIRTKYNIF